MAILGSSTFLIVWNLQTVVVITPLIPTSNSCYPQCLSVLSKCIVPVSVGSAVTAVAAKYILHKCVCIGHDSTFVVRQPIVTDDFVK